MRKNMKQHKYAGAKIQAITAISAILMLVISSFLVAPVMADGNGDDEFILTYNPTDDADIKIRAPNQNFGLSKVMKLKNNEGYSGNWDIDSLVKFDISNIPLGTGIVSAELYVYFYGFDDTFPGGRTISLYRLKENWDELTVTWNNQPNCEENSSSEGIVPSSLGKWMTFDVTDDVTKFVTEEVENHGWKLSDDVAWNDVDIPTTYLRTKEYGNFSPYLKIEYDDNVPPVVSHEVTGTKHNGFYTSDVEIGLFAEDALSGVCLISYSINLGPQNMHWNTTEVHFTLSDDGEYDISYLAVDNDANTAFGYISDIKIDQTAPITLINIEILEHGQESCAIIGLSGYDEISGVQKTMYKLDNAPEFVEYEGEIIVLGGGHHRIQYYSIDNAGNVENIKIEDFEIPKNIVIPLYRDYNLITIPVENDFMASTLAEEIQGCISISRFDVEEQTYKTYIVGGPGGFDFPIEDGIGYFVLTSTGSLLTLDDVPLENVQVDLVEGYNLLGHYEEQATSASEVFRTTQGCVEVKAFDAENQVDLVYDSPDDQDFVISRGMGYFVKIVLVNEGTPSLRIMGR